MLLDTNAISAWAEEDAGFLAVLRGDRSWYLPSIALGEYRFGLLSSRLRRSVEPLLKILENEAVILPVDSETVRPYAEVRDRPRCLANPASRLTPFYDPSVS